MKIEYSVNLIGNIQVISRFFATRLYYFRFPFVLVRCHTLL
jgi:hypothetical protein